MKTGTGSQNPKKPDVPNGDERLLGIFAACMGLLLGLAIVKFGNPVILENLIDWPTNIYEWIFNSWPAQIGYWLLAGVTVLGLFAVQWKSPAPKYLILLPQAWLFWEFVSATQTVSARLSNPTVVHFTTCVVCFYLGLLSLSRVRHLSGFWLGIMVGLAVALYSGFEQHFGGLQEARRIFYLYTTDLSTVAPELIKKMQTNRIFGTLFYPNALAGVILLVLPGALAVVWSWRERFTAGARLFLMTVLAGASMACLYWSGSKGGWLLLLIVGLVYVLFLPIKRRIKMMVIGCVLVLGLAGFAARYAGYFRRGAPSAVSRTDYWQAAIKTVKEKPVFGTGPGTFAIAYEKVRKPGSEMARLTHNDYLQQASDSGLPGFALYSAFIIGGLAYVLKVGGLAGDRVKLAVWLGVLGWAMQSFMEFGLYIPALAWPAFCLLGWLLGTAPKPIDTKHLNN